MDLANKISEIRKSTKLTQEEFAARLFVTRQAVSRWENGETTPTIDTLKKMSELFKIDANTFLGTEVSICQSCAMPLKNLSDLGENFDKTVNTEYCHYCFENGKFSNDRTIEEMVESNLKFLAEFNEGNNTNYTPDEARTILKLHLATLKRWKN